MVYVADSVRPVQRMPYQRSSGRVWMLQNRTSNSHCEICRWTFATEEQTALQGLVDRLNEIGVEINVEKIK